LAAPASAADPVDDHEVLPQLHQLAALEGPLSGLMQDGSLSVLIAGWSYGCETYSLGGFLALRFPRLNWRIDAIDISDEALRIAEIARYTFEHGLGPAEHDLATQIEAKLFDRSGDAWAVVTDIRQRISFSHGDVLSVEFQHFKITL
jgi:chemotaxis methyl-accepting protein methylase